MNIYKKIVYISLLISLLFTFSCTKKNKSTTGDSESFSIFSDRTTDIFPQFKEYPPLSKKELRDRFFYFSRDRSPIACNMMVLQYIDGVPDSLFYKYYIIYIPFTTGGKSTVDFYSVRFIDRKTGHVAHSLCFHKDGKVQQPCY